MPMPIGSLTGTTATSDVNTGPGAPTFIAKGMPISCVGDAVAGPTCSGAICMGAIKFIVAGRPAAMVTGQVAGVNPASGVPVTTAEMSTSALTLIIS